MRTKRYTPIRAPARCWRSSQRIYMHAADLTSGMVWLLRNALNCPTIEEPVTTEHGRAVFVRYDTPQAA